jgi:multiple sugar transport system permease protein
MRATADVAALPTAPSWLTPRWSNWRLALLAAAVLIPLAILALPQATAFWVSLAVAAAVAFAAVVNAWGRHTGGLLVAPALALLFVMNIFPLMWSFGLSFFSYRANRTAPPTFIGLDNYAWVLNDPTIWARLQTTALAGGADGQLADGRGLPPGAAVREAVPAAPLPADPGPHAR